MKVLHLISSSGMYGAEAVIMNLSLALREAGHDCRMGVFHNAANPNLQFHEYALNENFESYLIECAGQIDCAAIGRIRELVTNTGADVIHAHGYKADIYSYLALRGRNTGLVSTCHTWYDTDLLVSIYGKMDRFVLRNYSKVVAVSDEVRQRLLKAGVRAEKIHLVRNGIDLRPFGQRIHAAPEHPLVVGLIGRLSWEKCVDLYLRAAAKVLVEFPDARFVVAGDGPDRDKLERLIDELKVRANVELLGRREDMALLYASLDVMVSSSRQEGLPMAILEGMASELPLVATAVGEVPTVVLDGRTGLLVPAENVEALAQAIAKLLRDPAKRARFGQAARHLIEAEYSAERMAADYLSVYEEAIIAARGEKN